MKKRVTIRRAGEDEEETPEYRDSPAYQYQSETPDDPMEVGGELLLRGRLEIDCAIGDVVIEGIDDETISVEVRPKTEELSGAVLRDELGIGKLFVDPDERRVRGSLPQSALSDVLVMFRLYGR